MKRTTMLCAAMAALTLASCSKNEINEGGQSIANDPKMISFNSSTGLTRAVANDLTQVESGFTVLGFHTDGNKFIDGIPQNSTYSYDGGTDTWGWNSEVGKEWPQADKFPLTFYAEYPAENLNGGGALSKAITMDLNMASQTDFLVAKEVVSTRPETGFAPLNFKHILSNLVFKIETRENYKVVIQSIRVVNTAVSGRTFDYATMAYEDNEPVYSVFATTDGTFKAAEGFFYTGSTPYEFTGTTGATIGTVPTVDPDQIMMQMPQLTIPYWTNAAGGAGALDIFQKDAANWAKGTAAANAAARLAAWTNNDPTDVSLPGMKGSEGWKGARIEVIYRIYDNANSQSIVGRQIGESYTENGVGGATASEDLFVRVGYPLDLSAITGAKGWEMSKRYTYTIQMGTPGATNGILLEPGYKSNAGEAISPEVTVDNPATVDPGNPVTPGLINFTVGVDNWVDTNNGITIL